MAEFYRCGDIEGFVSCDMMSRSDLSVFSKFGNVAFFAEYQTLRKWGHMGNMQYVDLEINRQLIIQLSFSVTALI